MTVESPIKVVNSIPYIHIFEKHYITLALKDEIEKYQEQLVETEKLLKTPPTTAVPRIYYSLEVAPDIYRNIIRDLQTTLDRVESLQEVP